MDLHLAQATAASLTSWWKMIIMFLPFVPWAWLISSKLDKDARYYHFNVEMWNGIHLGAGVAALAAMLFIPIFWVSWPIGVMILAGPVLVYWKMRNEGVPADQRYYLSGAKLSERLEQKKRARANLQAALQFTKPSGAPHETPSKDSPLFPVHMVAEDIIGPALERRAHRIELNLTAKGCAVSQWIDGVRYKRDPIPVDQAKAVIDYLKSIGELDVEDRRRRQTSTVELATDTDKRELTIVTIGSSGGQQLVMEIDRTKRLSKPFDGLGLLPSQLEALRVLEQAHERHGIVLVGAPAGHGLTTSAYSLLSRHDAFTTNIKTLEREIQSTLIGVDQVQYDPGNPDVDYATHLQSILRRDPDIVLVDIIRDRETARIVTEPGMDGPLIYVQQVAGSVTEQIRDWVKTVGDVKVAAKSLRAVVNGRVIRRLSEATRQPYKPTEAQLKKLNLPVGKVKEFYKANGQIMVKGKLEPSPICGGTGYLGQTGIFEVMPIDDECRKLLGAGDLKAALAHARRNKMIYLQEAALSKVVSGETSLEEVIRVTAATQPAEGKTPAGTAA